MQKITEAQAQELANLSGCCITQNKIQVCVYMGLWGSAIV